MLHIIVEAVAHFKISGSGNQLFNKDIMNGVLHQNSVGADAGLAAVAVLRDQRPLHCRINIRVVKDNERRVAAQLHRGPLQRRGTGLLQSSPHLCRAGEGELPHQGTIGERWSYLRGCTDHNIQNPCRYARPLGKLCHGEG